MYIEDPNPKYESCDNCLYCNDSEEKCIIRGCVHAVLELKECYEERQGVCKIVLDDFVAFVRDYSITYDDANFAERVEFAANKFIGSMIKADGN